MARFGKLPVLVPENVTVKVEGDVLMVKGPKGEVSKKMARGIVFELSENEIMVKPKSKNHREQTEALRGTCRSHLLNMIHGVTEGWSKSLEIVGAGYRANVSGKELTMMIGYSHPVVMEIPEGLSVSVEKSIVTVSGVDKDKLGQFAAEIRAKREPEPYKGSGIKYSDEIIRRKAGKQAAKAA